MKENIKKSNWWTSFRVVLARWIAPKGMFHTNLDSKVTLSLINSGRNQGCLAAYQKIFEYTAKQTDIVKLREYTAECIKHYKRSQGVPLHYDGVVEYKRQSPVVDYDEFQREREHYLEQHPELKKYLERMTLRP